MTYRIYDLKQNKEQLLKELGECVVQKRYYNNRIDDILFELSLLEVEIAQAKAQLN